MKNGVFYIFVAVLLLSGTEMVSAQKKGVDGVTIDGVVWATHNVGAKGKFVKNRADAGRYYTFEEAQGVCPAGWRTPRVTEFETLIAAGSSWTTEDGVPGRRFGNGADTIFFPAAGGRYAYAKELADVGTHGYYWSSVAYSDALGYDLPEGAMAYNLRFSEGDGSAFPIYHNNRAFGYPVRCVKE